MSVVRLNLGCGPNPAAGWINLDLRREQGVQLCCDLRRGLALATECADYAVGMHVLQDLPWPEIPPAVSEMYRVLKPRGVLRLGLPDLDRAIDAYRRKDAGYFYVSDAHMLSLGGKLVTQIVWYGSVRTPFTFDFARELLIKAGLASVVSCAFQRTESAHPQIVELDNRPRETLFVEATK
jgi:SAM-dependent methyltransferase